MAVARQLHVLQACVGAQTCLLSCRRKHLENPLCPNVLKTCALAVAAWSTVVQLSRACASAADMTYSLAGFVVAMVLWAAWLIVFYTNMNAWGQVRGAPMSPRVFSGCCSRRFGQTLLLTGSEASNGAAAGGGV